MPPDGALLILGLVINIPEASHLILTLLASIAPPYDKSLDWLQVAYTCDRFVTYVAPASTEFSFHTLAEGEPLFAPAL